MILKKASRKAIKYACMNFHYAKVMPVTNLGYSVFNDKGEWCGVILYGGGASPYMGSPLAYRCGFTEYVDYLADIDVEVEGFEQ